MEHPLERSKTRGLGAYFGVGLLVAVLFGVYYVYPLRTIALVSLLTLLFAVILAAPVDYLARRGLRRGWGLLLVVVAGLLLSLLLVQYAADPLVSQARRLTEDFPALLAQALGLVESLPFGLGDPLAPYLDPEWLIGFLRDSGLSVATVFGWGSSAANLLALGIVVVLTGAFEIAADLFVTVGTIKAHTSNIYAKLQVRNCAAALARGRELCRPRALPPGLSPRLPRTNPNKPPTLDLCPMPPRPV